jgi:non-specific serine/threonine protein kinase
VGDRQGIASSLNALGVNARVRGDFAEARVYHEEALEICNSREDPYGVGETSYHFALMAIEQGRYADARVLLDQTLERGKDLGSGVYTAFANDAIAVLDRATGEADRARAVAEDVLAFIRQSAPGRLPTTLMRLATIARSQGDLDAAGAFAQEAAEDAERQDVPIWIVDARHTSALVSFSHGDLERAREGLAWALRRRADLGLRPDVEQSIEALAHVEAAERRAERAATLLGAADALRSQLGTVVHPADRREHEDAIVRTREAIGDDAFRAAWSTGANMSMDEAVAFALDG